jgi:hypothetical protein
VVVNIRTGIDDQIHGLRIATEIRCQNLHCRRFFELVQAAKTAHEPTGSTIGKVVPVNCGDDDVLEIHLHDCVNELLRLFGIQG